MKILLAALVIGAAVAAAAPASADPADLVPYCSDDQTPMDSNCRATSSQIIVHDGMGISPNLRSGLTPDDEPAT